MRQILIELAVVWLAMMAVAAVGWLGARQAGLLRPKEPLAPFSLRTWTLPFALIAATLFALITVPARRLCLAYQLPPVLAAFTAVFIAPLLADLIVSVTGFGDRRSD
jgi:hypothetical protein